METTRTRNRRSQGRCLCAQMVQVRWTAPAEPGSQAEVRTVEAVLEDISSRGGCVQVEDPIPLGSALTLSLGGSDFPGHACYCVYRDYGYFVGIRFSEHTAWSREQVLPQHLLDLQNIARHASR